jgi:hypothetical protein
MVCAFIWLGAASANAASFIGGPVVNPANNHLYYLLDTTGWVESEDFAVNSLDGHLVTINDAAENQWVFDTFGSSGAERS